MSLYALSSLPAPSGGAVRLTVHTSNHNNPYALVLASASAEPPDPLLFDEQGARRVFGGRMVYRIRQGGAVTDGYIVMDLHSGQLPDHETVFYHVFEIMPGGGYGEPLTISAVPSCTRNAVVTLARLTIKERLKYHLGRAVAEGLLGPNYQDEIPVLEKETIEHGFPLPAVFVKEQVSPDPSKDTVGFRSQTYTDAHNPQGVKEYAYSYSARVDVLVMADNVDIRNRLEGFIRGALDADRDLMMAAGLEAPSVSAFPNHELSDAYDTYTAELAINATVTTRITEAQAHRLSRVRR